MKKASKKAAKKVKAAKKSASPKKKTKAKSVERKAAAKKAIVDNLHTDRFGLLVLNRQLNWYECEAEWNGETINISFELDDDDSVDAAVRTAEKLWSKQQAWRRKVNDFAILKLLKLKNDSWTNEDEGDYAVTKEQFLERMTLQSITVCPDGDFEFWHEDGDLFCGHSIQISGNLTEGCTDADIPG